VNEPPPEEKQLKQEAPQEQPLLHLDGIPLSMAVSQLLPKLHMRLWAAALRNAESMRDAPGIRHYRSVLWPHLVQVVANRQAIATGFAPAARAGDRTIIDPIWVQDATPDFDKNTLSLGDVTYSGVRFGQAPTDTGNSVSDSCSIKPTQSEIDFWMASHSHSQTKRDFAIKDCVRMTGATHQQARAAWNKLPAEIKGTRGRKKP
jgi:hypothetical protein